MFARLGSWCFRKRKTVAILWVLGIVVVGAASSAIGGSFGQDFTPPGFESTRGIDTLEEEFGGQGAGIPGTIVFQVDAGIDDPEVRAAMEQLFAMVAAIAADPDVDLQADPAFAGLDDDGRQALEAADLTLFDGMTVVSP
ncbi:MAG: hypothetical protein ABIX10_15205, partial [Acidimicrobiales bacterium]